MFVRGGTNAGSRISAGSSVERGATALRFGALALAVFVAGCGLPYVARDGTIVFPEDQGRGAAVLTANGVEFRDRADIPQRIVRRDPNEPWRTPVGFLLPKSGIFKETSRPTVIATTGLAVVLRPSDVRVPSWGGEMLVRLELIAPASSEQARPPERVAFVVAAGGDDADREPIASLVAAALEATGAGDRVLAVDDAARTLIRPVPGRYRTLVAAAIDRREEEPAVRARPRAALELAQRLMTEAGQGQRRIVVLGDGHAREWHDPDVARTVERLAGEGTRISFVGVSESADAVLLGNLAMAGAGVSGTSSSIEDRKVALRAALPPSGDVRFREMTVAFSGVPAPVQVIEASAGEVRWRLDGGELFVGDVAAGEARADVLRVSVPPWVPGESFALRAEARFVDAATGEEQVVVGDLSSVYDEDIERLAESRAGDVIAFASALATMKRLDRAFLGPTLAPADLRQLAALHVKSMSHLARDTQDSAIREQADVLRALLDVSGGPAR